MNTNECNIKDELDNSKNNASLKNMMCILNEINQNINIKKNLIRDLEHSEQ
jgi:hypothetical protein